MNVELGLDWTGPDHFTSVCLLLFTFLYVRLKFVFEICLVQITQEQEKSNKVFVFSVTCNLRSSTYL